MYSAFIGAQSSLPLMECAAALVLSSNAALGGCSGLQVATFANPQQLLINTQAAGLVKAANHPISNPSAKLVGARLTW